MKLAPLTASLDFLLRLAFFAIAPFFVVLGAQLFPVTGAIVQIALALVLFVTGEAVRGRLPRSGVIASVFSSQRRFDAYYREHAPRPFLYYIAYPLLLPYTLVRADTRREFLIYKGYTLTSLGLLLVSLGVQYMRAFPPELGLRDFIPIALGTLLAESVVVLMFLMPIVTSVVHFHQHHAPRRLAILLCAALVSVAFAGVRLERRRDPIVSFATRNRVLLRSSRNPSAAARAQKDALARAWPELRAQLKEDVDYDGKVEGLPLETARASLTSFYRNDEAHAFDLWYERQRAHALLVLYFEAHRGHDPIWIASDAHGRSTHEIAKLPRGAFAAMRHAAH